MTMAFANPLAPAGFGATAPPPLSLVDEGVGATGTLVLGPFDVSNYQVLNLYIAPFVGAATSLAVYLQWQSAIGAGTGDVVPLGGGTGIPLARKLLVCRNGSSIYYECPNFGPRLTVTIVPTDPISLLWSGPCNLQVRNGPMGVVAPINADYNGYGNVLAEVSQVLGAGAGVNVTPPLVSAGLAMLRVEHGGGAQIEARVDTMTPAGAFIGGGAALATPAADFCRSTTFYLAPSQMQLAVFNRGGAATSVYASVTLL